MQPEGRFRQIRKIGICGNRGRGGAGRVSDRHLPYFFGSDLLLALPGRGDRGLARRRAVRDGDTGIECQAMCRKEPPGFLRVIRLERPEAGVRLGDVGRQDDSGSEARELRIEGGEV